MQNLLETATGQTIPENMTGRETLLLRAILKYEDAVDMMFDGPDESDRAYAKARWREGKELLREFLEAAGIKS